MPSKTSEYKGSPTISLHSSEDCTDQFPFTFGLRKAQLILAHIDEIQEFVDDNEEEEKEDKKPAKKATAKKGKKSK